MPFPILAGIAAGAAGQFLNGGIQEFFNGQQNRRNIDYYNIQRQDALSDYRRDLAYNDPSAQVARVKAAGFSPHSIGGQSLTVSAPQTRASSISNAPSSYRVDSANSYTQTATALEQLKGMKLSNARTAEEVRSAAADANSKELNYDVDRETLRTSRINSVHAQTNQDAEHRSRMERSTYDNTIARLESLYKNDMLRGNRDLLNANVKDVISKTHGSDISNSSARLHLRNLPHFLATRQDHDDTNAKSAKLDLDSLKDIPPTVRYILERSGLKELLLGRFRH